MHVDTIGAVLIGEIVDVGAAQGRREIVEDVRQRCTQLRDLRAVDDGIDLRTVGAKGREHAEQVGIAIGRADELTAGRAEVGQRPRAVILELEVESAQHTQARYRWRIDQDDLRLRDTHGGRLQRIDNALRGIRIPLALGPRLERYEDQPLVGGCSVERIPADRENMGDVRVRQRGIFELLDDRLRHVERRAVGRLHRADEVALVFFGEKARGCHGEEHVGEHEQTAQHARDDVAQAHGTVQEATVELRELCQTVIEGPEDREARLGLRAHEQRRQRRRQGQRENRRERDRKRDR